MCYICREPEGPLLRSDCLRYCNCWYHRECALALEGNDVGQCPLCRSPDRNRPFFNFFEPQLIVERLQTIALSLLGHFGVNRTDLVCKLMDDWLLRPLVPAHEPLDNHPMRDVFFLVSVGAVTYLCWNLYNHKTRLWHACFSFTLAVIRFFWMISERQDRGFDIPIPLLFMFVVGFTLVARIIEIALLELKDISSN